MITLRGVVYVTTTLQQRALSPHTMVFSKEDVATPTSEAFWEEMQEYEVCDQSCITILTLVLYQYGLQMVF